jgi:hypothetical protein
VIYRELPSAAMKFHDRPANEKTAAPIILSRANAPQSQKLT